MLKKHSQVFLTFLFLSDVLIVVASWIASYYLRFNVGLIPVFKPKIPPFELYLSVTIYAIVIWPIAMKALGLYAPMRTATIMEEATKIIKASVVALLVFITVVYFLREYKFSRVVFFYFGTVSAAGLIISRTILRILLRYVRRKGYNLRFVLIVGAGALGQRILRSIQSHHELGLRATGFLTRRQEKVGTAICGVPVLGMYDDVQRIIHSQHVDQVILALPLEEGLQLRQVMGKIDNELVDIKVVPDFFDYITLRGGVEELDSIPIISLRSTPLYGWNRIMKRLFDMVFSLIILTLISPLLMVIAALVKMSSPGPIFYSQERMGLDGNVFRMLKFRTMVEGAEKEVGPTWAKEGDGRRTGVGALLRKTSLDEVPQFINVLRGEMSIVGPRPERPFFIKQFRALVPKYMLRHKVKAGITGWAQINGWRGDTSVKERIEHDIYYIENWSLWFDFKICFLTLFKGFVNKNAY
ncbi:MAG: undecaprenyl-phosphate glucose phosphotransferase [Deltaproteobacteria bacterium]|nr:undecaprenyl-phosphate glucose phosphotransferase [Deltaproteobacteria bacterium]